MSISNVDCACGIANYSNSSFIRIYILENLETQNIKQQQQKTKTVSNRFV